jgi:hypothetical protein
MHSFCKPPPQLTPTRLNLKRHHALDQDSRLSGNIWSLDAPRNACYPGIANMRSDQNRRSTRFLRPKRSKQEARPTTRPPYPHIHPFRFCVETGRWRVRCVALLCEQCHPGHVSVTSAALQSAQKRQLSREREDRTSALLLSYSYKVLSPIILSCHCSGQSADGCQ